MLILKEELVMEKHSDQIVRTADVLGKKVMSAGGEDLGKIEEIVLDKVSGDCRYVVLSFGGILGMESKFLAIPWEKFSYEPEQGEFSLSIDKEKLEQASGFDKNIWPDNAIQEWYSGI